MPYISLVVLIPFNTCYPPTKYAVYMVTRKGFLIRLVLYPPLVLDCIGLYEEKWCP